MDKIKPLDVPVVPVAIQRLIDEIRIETESKTGVRYNRVYSRHNRS